MRFTRGCFKQNFTRAYISTGGRTCGRFSQNQNFLDAYIFNQIFLPMLLLGSRESSAKTSLNFLVQKCGKLCQRLPYNKFKVAP